MVLLLPFTKVLCQNDVFGSLWTIQAKHLWLWLLPLVTCYRWHPTQDMGHMTRYTWHMTHKTWKMTQDTWFFFSRCYYPHTSRDSVSPVKGILNIQSKAKNLSFSIFSSVLFLLFIKSSINLVTLFCGLRESLGSLCPRAILKTSLYSNTRTQAGLKDKSLHGLEDNNMSVGRQNYSEGTEKGKRLRSYGVAGRLKYYKPKN